MIVERKPARFPAGTFIAKPVALILHSSRSGRAPGDEQPSARAYREYSGTVAWCQSANNGGIGWHVTVGETASGEPIYCVHLADQWAWHCRELSSTHLGIEFSQPTVNDAISDAQVAAAAHWLTFEVFPRWPHLSRATLDLPAHSETAPGKRDGKSDPFPAGDGRLENLRQRLRAQLGSMTQPPPPESSDAAMERVYQANAVTLGAQRFAGYLSRDFYAGPVLVCDGGVVTPTGLLDYGRLIDDWVGLNETAGTLRRY